ncbi:MAG: UDP-N-acetylmuramoyl-L-alanine--D-glutamate ligase [Candidatus Komeilibacteria bacterium]
MSKLFFAQETKFLVMGLGLHGGGAGVAAWLGKHRYQTIITDQKTAKELASVVRPLRQYKTLTWHLGGHQAVDFRDVDIIIANPAVRRDHPLLETARQAGVEIYNDMSFFLQLCPASVIAVTGTKGKSTTANIIYQLLKVAGKSAYLGGNIRISPFKWLDKMKPNDWVVLEMSSWQCEGLASHSYAPAVAVLTNIGRDHLNTYDSWQSYRLAKSLLFRYQTKNDLAVFNKDDKDSQVIANNSQATKRFFSLQSKGGVRLADNMIYYQHKKLLPRNDIKLLGRHNSANILAALQVADYLGINPTVLRQGLRNIKALAGRCQLIRRYQGVSYYNDTTATAPTATMSTVASLAEPLVLIAGGTDKRLAYKKLATLISRRVKYLVLLPGSATDLLVKELRLLHYKDWQVVTSMLQAVKVAAQRASKGEVVLLSPAAASFGLFVNEFDRGDKFNQAVKAL